MDLSKLTLSELNELSKKITIEKRIRNPKYKTNIADKCVNKIKSFNYINCVKTKDIKSENIQLSNHVNNFLDGLSTDNLFNFNIKNLNIIFKHDLSTIFGYIYQGGYISSNLVIEIISSIYNNQLTTRSLDILNEAFKNNPRFNIKYNLNNTQDLINLIKSELDKDLEITLQYNNFRKEYNIK